MTTLTFQNTTLSVINQHNQTFLTAGDLGLALEYANPLQAISKLYNSNADEFTAEMTALIEMPTAGGIQKVRIFSLRGAHLIAMFARTKVAKDFRKWVLDILDREIDTISPEQQQAIQAEVQQAHHRTGLHYQEIYRLLKVEFKIGKYDQLPACEFNRAMAFIANLQPTIQNPPLAGEALDLLVQAYHFLYQASDLRAKVQPTFIGMDIDRHFGSHYLHNLGKPLNQCMEKIQAYIHESSERLMFVQGMASLLETPKAKKAVFK